MGPTAETTIESCGYTIELRKTVESCCSKGLPRLRGALGPVLSLWSRALDFLLHSGPIPVASADTISRCRIKRCNKEVLHLSQHDRASIMNANPLISLVHASAMRNDEALLATCTVAGHATLHWLCALVGLCLHGRVHCKCILDL